MATAIPTRTQIEAMSGPELVETYNTLTGKSVKKFAMRSKGIARVLHAVEEAIKEKREPITPPSPKNAKPKEAIPPRRNHGKPPRTGSKRSQAIALLSRKSGATRDELGKTFAWKPRDVADALRIIVNRDGYKLTEDDGGRIKVVS